MSPNARKSCWRERLGADITATCMIVGSCALVEPLLSAINSSEHGDVLAMSSLDPTALIFFVSWRQYSCFCASCRPPDDQRELALRTLSSIWKICLDLNRAQATDLLHLLAISAIGNAPLMLKSLGLSLKYAPSRFCIFLTP